MTLFVSVVAASVALSGGNRVNYERAKTMDVDQMFPPLASGICIAKCQCLLEFPDLDELKNSDCHKCLKDNFAEVHIPVVETDDYYATVKQYCQIEHGHTHAEETLKNEQKDTLEAGKTSGGAQTLEEETDPKALPTCPEYIYAGFCDRADVAGGAACIDVDVLNGEVPLTKPEQVECVPIRNGAGAYVCPAEMKKTLCAKTTIEIPIASSKSDSHKGPSPTSHEETLLPPGTGTHTETLPSKVTIPSEMTDSRKETPPAETKDDDPEKPEEAKSKTDDKSGAYQVHCGMAAMTLFVGLHLIA